MLQETNNNCVILYPADDMINNDIPHESLMSAYNLRGGALGWGGDEQQPVPRALRHDRHPGPPHPGHQRPVRYEQGRHHEDRWAHIRVFYTVISII